MLRIVFFKITIACFLLMEVSCSSKHETPQLPYYNSPDFTPHFISSSSAATMINHTIDTFSFTNQDGKRITRQDVKSKIHVANFIFTSCGSICPVMTKNMKLLEAQFANNPGVVMLSYSVTPWIDNVSRLHNYAMHNNILASNWHLLTGSKAAIYKLARQSYFAEEDLGVSKDSSEFLHTEHVLLIDRNLKIRGIYNGTLQLEAEQLVKDIRELLKEE